MFEYVSEEDKLVKLVHRIFPEQRKWEEEQKFDFTGIACSKLGMIEEVGELAHAVLKMKQGIREPECFKKHPELAKTMSRDEGFALDMIDAVGDIMIYYVSFLNQLLKADEEDEGDFLNAHETFYERIIPDSYVSGTLAWQDYSDRPDDALLTITDHIWNEDDGCLLPAILNKFCEEVIYPITKDENIQRDGAFYCMQKTWDNIVKKRDWQKNKKTGEV